MSSNTNSITFDYEKIQRGEHVIRKVDIIMNEQVLGSFTIEGIGKGECFGTGHTCSMGIRINDGTNRQGKPYTGRGWARQMIQYMTKMIRDDCPSISDNQKLFIDTDASDGFWDRIGMTNNPHYEMDDSEPFTPQELRNGAIMGTNFRGRPVKVVEGRGYEKVITFVKLEQFGQSGGRHKTRRHKTRRHKTRWHKTRRHKN
jgi:hypothetical protein